MGNLSAARDYYPRRLPHDTEYGQTTQIVKSGITIYKGSLVVFAYETGALTGYVTFAADTANAPFAGVAAETVTGDGTLTIRLWVKGEHYFTKGTPAITDVGTEFYDVTNPGTVTSVAGNVKVGKAIDYDSAGLWLRIDNYALG